MSQFSITDSQLAILNSLRCERLSSDERHLRMVDCFCNYRNEALVNILQNEAFEEDEAGELAYYVVKDNNNEILCYFSLKSGLLFDKLGELEILQSKKKLRELVARKKLISNDSEAFSAIGADLDKEIERLKKELRRHYELYENDNVHKRVAKTYAGIELVHFCVNEYTRHSWDKYNFGDKNRLGMTIFWHIIVPIILEIKKYAGITYLYLFAADASFDLDLVNHYVRQMSFKKDEDIFAALPVYDSGCVLLCQKVDNLLNNRERFYEEFNLNEETLG